jgi:hypothetical protein
MAVAITALLIHRKVGWRRLIGWFDASRNTGV